MAVFLAAAGWAADRVAAFFAGAFAVVAAVAVALPVDVPAAVFDLVAAEEGFFPAAGAAAGEAAAAFFAEVLPLADEDFVAAFRVAAGFTSNAAAPSCGDAAAAFLAGAFFAAAFLAGAAAAPSCGAALAAVFLAGAFLAAAGAAEAFFVAVFPDAPEVLEALPPPLAVAAFFVAALGAADEEAVEAFFCVTVLVPADLPDAVSFASSLFLDDAFLAVAIAFSLINLSKCHPRTAARTAIHGAGTSRRHEHGNLRAGRTLRCDVSRGGHS